MNCKQCGTEFEGKFCPNCGTQVVAESSIPSTQSISQSTEKVTVKMQRAKKPFYKKWWFFALILIVIIAVVGCIAGGNKSEKIEWSKMRLAEILPESESNKGKIYENTDEELWIELYKTSEDQFNDYISLCKAKGFTVDASTTSISYEAYNNDGYSLNLIWYNDQMTIWLVSPMEFTTIQWPSSTVGMLLPTPESTVGKFSFENDDSFFVYIGNTTKADFGEYVIACADKDFNIDFNKGDTYYYADNSEGYHVSVMYEGNNVMSIRIDSPDDSENATSTEPNNSSSTQPETSAAEDFAAKYGITVELAQSLEDVLAGIELTDTSRVGVFHYDLSDVESFKQTNDWAEGDRYTMSMDGEHIWIAYSKDDIIVGIKGSNGDTFYQAD